VPIHESVCPWSAVLQERPALKGLLATGAQVLSHRDIFAEFQPCSRAGAVELEPPSRLSPSQHLLGADRVSLIRNSSNGSVLPACTVQKVAVEASSAFERSDSSPALGGLVSRLVAGDEEAFAQLYDRTNRIVYGLALRILGDPSSAEDVTMEVYLQVWRTASRYDPQRGTATSWLVTLVRSRALDCLRSRKARRANLEDSVDDVHDLHDSRPSPELASLESGRSRIVQRAMTDLAPDQREAIELAYFSGLSHSEVAIQTGVPLGTTKTRIRLGMIHLRRLLGPYAEGL
jgi:RNA polymerase sigma-70 factor (ECF subfamily)